MKLFYLGPEGSFSGMAASYLAEHQKNSEPTPCHNWQEIWQKLETDNGSSAVVPIENSITSNVHANIDVLFEGKFKILQEVFLNIQLSLFSLEASDIASIEEVYSHPQALAQAKQLIKKYGWRTHETTSTTAALHLLKDLNRTTIAALAPSFTNIQKLQNIQCLIENAQDVEQNQTRFVVVSHNQTDAQQGNKATLIVEAAHEVGSLGKLLGEFSRHGFNLTKIESRPIPGKTWVYQFWIDIILPNSMTSVEVSKILDSIDHISSYQMLGIYESGSLV